MPPTTPTHRSCSRRHSTHETAPRTQRREPRIAQPFSVKTVEAPIESSTDPRAGEQCKLQRLSDGTTRILLTDKGGAAATHGYPVTCAEVVDGLAVLLYQGEGKDFDDYVVPARCWAALVAQCDLAANV